MSKHRYAHKQRRRTFECNSVPLHRCNGLVGDDSLAALQDGRDADLLPLDRNLGEASISISLLLLSSQTYISSIIYAFDRLADLGTDAWMKRQIGDRTEHETVRTISRNQSDGVFALMCTLTLFPHSTFLMCLHWYPSCQQTRQWERPRRMRGTPAR